MFGEPQQELIQRASNPPTDVRQTWCLMQFLVRDDCHIVVAIVSAAHHDFVTVPRRCDRQHTLCNETSEMRVPQYFMD